MRDVLEFGALALMVLTSLGTYLPQLTRTWRRRDASGLSPSALLLAIAAYGSWYLYLAIDSAWLMFAANAFGSVVVAALIVAAARAGLRFAGAWHSAAIAAAAALVAAAIDYSLLGLVLTAMSFISWVPKVWAAWRSASISGISVWMWLMVAGSGVAHLTLGMMGRPFAVFMVGISASVASALVLTAIAVRGEARHGSPATAPPGSEHPVAVPVAV